MHLKIKIGKEFIISVLISVIALIYLITGTIGMFYQKNAVEPDKITRGDCITGKYVSGTVSSYLVKKVIDIHSGLEVYSGIYDEQYIGGRKYNIYTIPGRDDLYIRIAVYNKDTIAKLEAFSQGKGEGFHFDGKMKKAGYTNGGWYKDVEAVGENSADRIIQDIIIVEINPHNNILLLIAGFILLIIAASFFTHMGGMKEVVSERAISKTADDEDIDAAFILEYSKQKELNLIEEKRKLEGLYEKLKEMKTHCMYACVGAAFGIIIIINSHYADSWIFGIALTGFSISIIAKYYLNSGNKYADRIMIIFDRESVAEQIIKKQDFVKILEEAVEKEKHGMEGRAGADALPNNVIPKDTKDDSEDASVNIINEATWRNVDIDEDDDFYFY